MLGPVARTVAPGLYGFGFVAGLVVDDVGFAVGFTDVVVGFAVGFQAGFGALGSRFVGFIVPITPPPVILFSLWVSLNC
jgi:hypothetical protein